MSNRVKAVLVILFGVVLTLGGTVLLLLNQGASLVQVLLRELGIALIVTGTITVTLEPVMMRLRRDEAKAGADQIQTAIERVSSLLRGPGMYQLSTRRHGEPRYHRWLLETNQQDMFFAGHSVLHRVHADFEARNLLPVHEALRRKLAEGSVIRILFLDPTWDLIEKIARDEGQDPRTLRKDLATTLSICRRLWQLLKKEVRLPGSLQIRTCREFKRYAFHHVTCPAKNEAEMLVGFYFASSVGTRSPLFVVENEAIQELFAAHFSTIFERATTLLACDRSGIEFNREYYGQCEKDLTAQLPEEERASVEDLLRLEL